MITATLSYAAFQSTCQSRDTLSEKEAETLERELYVLKDQISLKEYIECLYSFGEALQRSKLSFHEEPKISVATLSGESSVAIPFSVFKKSVIGSQAEEGLDEEPCPISLPWGMGPEEFEHYTLFLGENPPPISDFETWINVIKVGSRLSLDRAKMEAIYDKKPEAKNIIAKIERLLLENEDIPFLREALSYYLNSYIQSGKKQALSIDEICTRFFSSEIIRNSIHKIPISLELDFPITGREFHILQNSFSNVTKLVLSIEEIPNPPLAWRETLEHLELKGNISRELHCDHLGEYIRLKSLSLISVNIKALPPLPETLQEFKALSCNDLVDYSSLNHLKNLKKCELEYCPITHLPVGWKNLEEFHANNCLHLTDYSSLNNLSFLKKCVFVSCPITSTPSGCRNLRAFVAYDCKHLTNYDSLDHLISLKHLELFGCPIIRAPQGCKNLETFWVYFCRNLVSYTGLNNLTSLKHVEVTRCPMTIFPTGCRNLETVLISGNEHLIDYSELNNQRALKCCDLESCRITAAPRGCINLEEFSAIKCTHLTDCSGLNDAIRLKKYKLKETPVDGWEPRRKSSLEMPNLEAQLELP